MRQSRRMEEVQTPIIPIVGDLVRSTPGTISLGQGMVAYGPPREAIDAIAGVTDEQLREIWTLKFKGQLMFAMPKYNVVRIMCFNHIVHHRAQLTMYLRTLDVAVPALYGPSADEQSF